LQIDCPIPTKPQNDKRFFGVSMVKLVGVQKTKSIKRANMLKGAKNHVGY
jgi:hypothetical protein